jgi:hypothetical protein
VLKASKISSQRAGLPPCSSMFSRMNYDTHHRQTTHRQAGENRGGKRRGERNGAHLVAGHEPGGVLVAEPFIHTTQLCPIDCAPPHK